MHPTAQNALTDLKARLKRPTTWGFGIGVSAVLILNSALFEEKIDISQWLIHSLVVFLIVFLSPVIWQARVDRRTLNPWRLVLPASILVCSLLALLPWLAERYFLPKLLTHSGYFSLLVRVWILFMLSGGLLSHIACIHERTAQEEARAKSAWWMRNSAPFDPGLLANQLNYLASQVEVDPAGTIDDILVFAKFYRNWLAMTAKPLISLEDERKLLAIFENVENARTGGLFHIQWYWAPGPTVWRLPPFCLFSLASLMASAGSARLELDARLEHQHLHLSLQGKLPVRCLEHPVIRGVSNSLSQVFGDTYRLEVKGDGTVLMVLPEVEP